MRRADRALFALSLLSFLAHPLVAHHSWIMPDQHRRTMELGHGHSFPVSEQVMSPSRIEITLFDGAGSPFHVTPVKEPKRLSAPIPDRLRELSAALFVEEAVILTRTTKGVKTGPMTQFQGVVDSFRRHRSGLFQASPGVTAPPCPQALLSCHREQERLTLLLKRGTSPVAQAEIQHCQPGGEEITVGLSDAQGRLSLGKLKPGLHLFSANWSIKSDTPDTQRDEFTTTLVVLIE